jgi:hypothetical protein
MIIFSKKGEGIWKRKTEGLVKRKEGKEEMEPRPVQCPRFAPFNPEDRDNRLLRKLGITKPLHCVIIHKNTTFIAFKTSSPIN